MCGVSYEKPAYYEAWLGAQPCSWYMDYCLHICEIMSYMSSGQA